MDPTHMPIVMFCLSSGPNAGEYRPAVVVREWNATCLNLLVFGDGSNDGPEFANGPVWKTSIVQGDGVQGTWRHLEERDGVGR